MIKNFVVTKNKDGFAETENNPFILHFYDKTMVNEIYHDNNVIPCQNFEFVNFEILQKLGGKYVLIGDYTIKLYEMSYHYPNKYKQMTCEFNI